MAPKLFGKEMTPSHHENSFGLDGAFVIYRKEPDREYWVGFYWTGVNGDSSLLCGGASSAQECANRIEARVTALADRIDALRKAP